MDQKENTERCELKVAQQLLAALPTLDAKTVTADLLHCQKETARLIAEKGGDYFLQLKGNQPTLLAYANTLWPPKQGKPDEGVFLEYAPIRRRYDIPYEQQQKPDDRDSLAALDANLKVFPANTAQALEYWLDVSLFSRQARPPQKRPGVKLPWNKDVFRADLETYRKRGIRHITTFAVYVDADYAKKYGDLSFIAEYGAGLLR
jgi:hypothetical protein